MQLKSRVTDVLDERLKGGVIVQVLAAVVGNRVETLIFFLLEVFSSEFIKMLFLCSIYSVAAGGPIRYRRYVNKQFSMYSFKMINNPLVTSCRFI